jgi:hypothetical protein
LALATASNVRRASTSGVGSRKTVKKHLYMQFHCTEEHKRRYSPINSGTIRKSSETWWNACFRPWYKPSRIVMSSNRDKEEDSRNGK